MTYFASDTAKAAELNTNAHKHGHCGGWLLSNGPTTETLYAVLPDGRIVSRVAAQPNPNFNHHAAKWSVINALPDGAEWIGCYPVPRNIRPEA